MLDVLKADGVHATFFVNTHSHSDWLGPFNSTGNQVGAAISVAERMCLFMHWVQET